MIRCFCLWGLTLLSTVGVVAQSEYGIVEDEDGWTNVRSSPSLSANIIGQVREGEIFWINTDLQLPNWCQILYLEEDASNYTDNIYVTGLDDRVVKQGYVHSSRVKNLTEETIELERVCQDNHCRYFNEQWEITVNWLDFATTDIDYRIDGVLRKIDGEFVWGTDGMMPSKSIGKLIIVHNGEQVVLDASALAGFYQPNIEALSLTYDHTSASYLVWMANSDGAGFYSALWQIKEGSCINRYAFAPY